MRNAGKVPGRSECSPRTRGWSRLTTPKGPKHRVLPAHAGMVPHRMGRAQRHHRAPRARGDGPGESFLRARLVGCSPRTRGWSPVAVPTLTHVSVLPAHAGMVPRAIHARASARGAPRARGDGPMANRRKTVSATCSPRTRGWSPARSRAATCSPVLPAHAGMVPWSSRQERAPASAPRARGDGPYGRQRHRSPEWCSPRTRGWSPDPGQIAFAPTVLPAHAGMVPPSR